MKKTNSTTRLSLLYLAVLESLNQSVNTCDNFNQNNEPMECSFIYRDEDIGTIKYTLEERIIVPGSKRSVDYPSYACEVQYIARYPYVEAIYSMDGNRLKNTETLLNKMLNNKYKF